jgi:hypothetical protein
VLLHVSHSLDDEMDRLRASSCLRLPSLTEPKINPDARDRDVFARREAFGRLALLRPDPFGDVELHFQPPNASSCKCASGIGGCQEPATALIVA